MKKVTLSLMLGFISALSFSQTTNDSISQDSQIQQNSEQSDIPEKEENALTLGAYGEIVYNQPEGDNGKLDVHRLVLLLGYQFSDKVQFFSEIEIEHVEEI
ncbi:MAG: hypothetical protein MUP24_13890, partial [Gillisia sp.]|nr:hypothetical protein [Gillisia sp.]